MDGRGEGWKTTKDCYKSIKILFLFLIPLISSGLTLDQFIDVLEQVESNGNIRAVGDSNKAYGILQIHSIMVQDYNRITKSNLIHSDCFNRETSREIAKTILINYTKNLKAVNAKHLAFIWNAGGSGWRYAEDPNYGSPKVRANLKKYWNKVLTEINK